jgi:hypothetical protein
MYSDEQPSSGALAVRFYQKEMQNEFQSEQSGRPVFYMADFVHIEIPGNQTSIIETFVNDSHKKRFPIQWAQYQNEKSSGSDFQGTPLRAWPILTSAQSEELKHFKFYTVEQVAAASDAQIGAIGMVAGMAPSSFRDKAKAFLSYATDTAAAQASVSEIAKRDQQIADLKAEIERIAKLAEAPRRGRPPKEELEAA